jgi:hypothetical protein
MSKFASLKESLVGNDDKYAVHNPHSLPPILLEKNVVYAAFIDPGIKTCAVRITRYNFDTGSIKTVLFKLFDFRVKLQDEKPFTTAGTSCYTACLEELDRHEEYFLRCHYIIIEYQGNWASLSTIRITHELVTYFLYTLKDVGNRPLIIEADPKLKSIHFGLRRMKKPDLKKTCLDIAIDILKDRGDNENAEVLEGRGKKDDLGDTVCYDEWFWSLLQDIREREKLGLYLLPIKEDTTQGQEKEQEKGQEKGQGKKTSRLVIT